MTDESYETIYDDLTGDPIYRPIIPLPQPPPYNYDGSDLPVATFLNAWGNQGGDLGYPFRHVATTAQAHEVVDHADYYPWADAAPTYVYFDIYANGDVNSGIVCYYENLNYDGSPSPYFTYLWQTSPDALDPWSDPGYSDTFSYQLQDADVGKYLRLVITAINDFGEATGTSDNVLGPVGPVVP